MLVGSGEGVVFGGGDGHEDGIHVHGVFGDEVKILGGGVLIVIGKAVGVGEMGVDGADLLGFLVHHFHEGRIVAVSDVVGDDAGGFAGGAEDHGVEQVDHSDILAVADVHIGGA